MIALLITGGFFVAAGCAGVRLLKGPTLADRIMAVDVALISLMGAIAADAAFTGDTSNLTLLAVIAIIGFTATVAASQFMEHEQERGR